MEELSSQDKEIETTHNYNPPKRDFSGHHHLYFPPPSNQLQQSPRQQRDPDPSSTIVKYRECLKNHAASMGSHVVDGCGEFMPSGEDGTIESLRCAACDCHRNFHRKETEVPSLHQQHHRFIPPMMVAFGGVPVESSGEDLHAFHSNTGGQPLVQASLLKKRFRTKFTQEQKNRMMEYAEKLGWKIQKHDEQEVRQFCSQVGVKRQVFKVWMHNNKQARKQQQVFVEPNGVNAYTFLLIKVEDLGQIDPTQPYAFVLS